MSDPLVHIFADESCLGNQFEDRANPGAAAGLIERFDERTGWYRRDYYESESDTTNNRMALRSAIVGLSLLKRPCRVVFVSDSQYLVRGMKDWIHGWAGRGWTRKGGPIENLEIWKRLAAATARHRIEWRWVRGHADHPKNEYANMLAIRTARDADGSDGLVPSGFDEWLQEQMESGKFADFMDLPDDEEFRPDRPAPAV